MGDLSKLKVALGQPEIVEGRPSRYRETQERMVERAVQSGADVLVLPGSLLDDEAVNLIALNDSRIDIAGSVVILEAAGETYRIGVGKQVQGCDFSVYLDVNPWTLSEKDTPRGPGIVLRPVGICNWGRKVVSFDGGTSVYGQDGRVLTRLRDDFEEDFSVISPVEDGERTDSCSDKLLAALTSTIRRFDEQVLGWQPQWVIGLSGGLDSSIVATLLVQALGSQRVAGFGLSTALNSEATKDNAASLAHALGIRYRTGSISSLVEATENVAREYGYGSLEDPAIQGTALENVQARVRGHLLSTFAALEGGVIANNGNRVEGAFGYATLYGDAIGALAPIGDLTKVRLFDLARSLNANAGCEMIPENLLPRISESACEWEVPPSAELSPGQIDPMKWFYHDWVVEQLLDSPSVDEGACFILEKYLEDKFASLSVGRWVSYYGLEDPAAFLKDLLWALKSLRTSAFKRIQAPPVITLASSASIAASAEVQGAVDFSPRFHALYGRVKALA